MSRRSIHFGPNGAADGAEAAGVDFGTGSATLYLLERRNAGDDGRRPIIALHHGPNRRLSLDLDSGGFVNGGLYVGAGTFLTGTLGGSAVPIGEWSAVAYVLTAPAADTAGSLKEYRDGALANTPATIAAGTSIAETLGNMGFSLGHSGWTPSGYPVTTDCDVAEGALFHRALSDAEAIALTGSGHTAIDPAQAGLVGLYQPSDTDTTSIPNKATGPDALAGYALTLNDAASIITDVPDWLQDAPTGTPVVTKGSSSDTTLTPVWTSVATATGYDIEIDGVVTSLGNVLTYTATGFTAESNHTFRVRGRNGGGPGPWSDLKTFTTDAAPVVAPEPPGFATFNVTATGCDYTITASAGASTYRIYNFGTLFLDNANLTGHLALSGSTPYSLTARAGNNAGESADSAASTFTTPVPSDAVRVVAMRHSVLVQMDITKVAPSLYNGSLPAPWDYKVAGRVRLWWSLDGSAWKQAQDMKRGQRSKTDTEPEGGTPSDPRMVGLILGQNEGSAVHWKITFEGGDWPQDLELTGSVTTLTGNPTLGPTVATVTLDGTETGSDVYTAIKAAFDGGADVVELAASGGAGVPLVVETGLFGSSYGGALSLTGTADAWKCIRVKDGHDITFDGADPVWDVIGGGNWELFTDANATPPITADMKVYKSTRVLDKNQRLSVYYERPGDDVGIRLMNQNAGMLSIGGTFTGLSGSMQTAAGRDGASMVFEPTGDGSTGYLYVRLYEGVDPETVRFKIPKANPVQDGQPVGTQVAYLSGSEYLVLKGIKARYFGNTAWGGGTSYAPANGGIRLDNCRNVVLDSCDLVCTNGFIQGSDSYYRNAIVVTGCSYKSRGLGCDAYPNPIPVPFWNDIKQSIYETVAIQVGGAGHSFTNNYWAGEFNGWSYTGSVPVSYTAGFMSANDTASPFAEAIEHIGNTFRGFGDDSLEPEQMVVGFIAALNDFAKCYKGISIAPGLIGPFVIVRNTWVGRGEYSDSSDSQSFLKVGNNGPDDDAYHLVANNTIVNVNDDVTKKGLFALMNSGSCYNAWFLNNLAACDMCPVFGYGPFSYPRVFDYNRYRATRLNSTAGYDIHQADFTGFAVYQRDLLRGESMDGSANHRFPDFVHWQQGQTKIGMVLPGSVAGVVPETPVIAMTPGGDSGYPASEAYWLNDSHGSYGDGGHELVDPYNGDFRPAAGNAAIEGAGAALANITFDNGPLWTDYDEAAPTLGAIPTGTPPPANTAPQLTPGSAPTGLHAGDTAHLAWSCTDAEGGAMAYALTIVAKPAGSALAVGGVALDVPSGTGIATADAPADVAGTYTVSLRVTDAGGLSAVSSITYTVAAAVAQNAAPAVTITGVTPASPIAGDTVTVAFSYTDADNGQTHTATGTLTAQPQGSIASAAAAITESPQAGTVTFPAGVAGAYTVRVDVSDGTATGSASVNITVGAAPDTTAPTPGAVNVLAVTASTITVVVGPGADDTGVVSRILTLYLDANRTQAAAEGASVNIGVNVLNAPLANTAYYGRVVYSDAAGHSAQTDFQTATLPAGAGQGADTGSDTESLFLPVRFQRGRPVNVGWQPVALRARLGDTHPPVTVLFVAMDGVTPLDVSGCTARLLWREQGKAAILGTDDGRTVQGETDRMAFDFPNPDAAGSYELLVTLTENGDTETCLDAIWLLVSA